VFEQLWNRKEEPNKILRPFSQAAKVKCRGYSLGLERVVTDFAADSSFEEVVQKVEEHYGIKVSGSRVRLISEKHGLRMSEQFEVDLRMPAKGVDLLINELDGSQVPCVEFCDGEGDKRKRRKVCWHEAKLCMARAEGSAHARYAATLKGIDKAGLMWRATAIESGAGRNTHFHCLGDGAKSIVGQVKEQFGEQASFLLDFYHVSEYLAQAAQSIAKTRSFQWLKEKQELLKENKSEVVMAELCKFKEAETVEDENAPVRRAFRYLSKRPEYLDYKSAIEKGLPIGSGEIEASHRSVVQARLKKSGAWWVKENAEKMLSLRVCRANGEWKSYWNELRQVAA
jgi:hypothetical protein